MIKRRGLDVPDDIFRAEGYLVDIQPEGILLAGYDKAGTFYAVQTLIQIIQQTAPASEKAKGSIDLTSMIVFDWPYKPVRGVHLYMPGREQIPFFKKFLDWLSSLKFNTLFIETCGGMEYKSHPEINTAWEKFCQIARQYPGGGYEMERTQPFVKMSSHVELGGGSYLRQEEVRDLVAYARELHFDVIPEMQSLSHTYYLCVAHPEIAERADDPLPDTYCPSNPHSYALLFDLLEEVIDVYRPRTIHMGHDEIIHLGICPRCKGKTGIELVSGDINQIHKFLKERGVRMAIWGDKLLPIISGGRWHAGMELKPENSFWAKSQVIPETYPAIEQIPKDILILNWYWSLDRESTNYLIQKGFDVLLGNIGECFTGQGFDYRWNVYSAHPKIVGGEVSTWCEISENEFSYFGIDSATAFCADMLWWSHYRESNRGSVSIEVAQQIRKLREIRYLDRNTAANSGLVAEKTPIPLGGPKDFHFPFMLPEGLPFVLPADFSIIRVDMDHPTAELMVGWKAERLFILHGAYTKRRRNPPWGVIDPSLGFDHVEIAQYLIYEKNGSVIEIPVRAGENIASWDIPYGDEMDAFPYWADPIPIGTDYTGQRVTFYQYEWMNSSLEKQIEKITVRFTGQTNESFWLAAVSKQ